MKKITLTTWMLLLANILFAQDGYVLFTSPDERKPFDYTQTHWTSNSKTFWTDYCVISQLAETGETVTVFLFRIFQKDGWFCIAMFSSPIFAQGIGDRVTSPVCRQDEILYGLTTNTFELVDAVHYGKGNVMLFTDGNISCKVEWTSSRKENLELVEFDYNGGFNWKFITMAEFNAVKKEE